MLYPIGSERLQKEYGKLTEDQLRRLVKKMPEVRAAGSELRGLLRGANRAKLKRALGEGMPWSVLYESTFAEHVAFVLVALGQKDWILSLKDAEDPQEEMLKQIYSAEEIEWTGGEGGQFTPGDVIGLTTTLQKTILSIMLFQRSLSGLVAEARDGDDDALFNAIRVDRSAVVCPTIAKRIWVAEVSGEKGFFLRLRNALKGPQHRHWEAYKDLRFSLYVLRELGFDKLSDAQLHHLLVKVLKVYPDSYSAQKNLRKQYYESRKIKTL